MKIDLKIELKKAMTKKAFKELQKRNRSVVSAGMNLGTRTMRSNKDRARQDREVAKMLRTQSWA